MRFLTLSLLAAACAVAPMAAAQTAGPTVPPARTAAARASALDGNFATSAPRAKSVHRPPKKQTAKHSARKPRASRSVARTKSTPHRAPVRQTATPGPELALRV